MVNQICMRNVVQNWGLDQWGVIELFGGKLWEIDTELGNIESVLDLWGFDVTRMELRLASVLARIEGMGFASDTELSVTYAWAVQELLNSRLREYERLFSLFNARRDSVALDDWWQVLVDAMMQPPLWSVNSSILSDAQRLLALLQSDRTNPYAKLEASVLMHTLVTQFHQLQSYIDATLLGLNFDYGDLMNQLHKANVWKSGYDIRAVNALYDAIAHKRQAGIQKLAPALRDKAQQLYREIDELITAFDMLDWPEKVRQKGVWIIKRILIKVGGLASVVIWFFNSSAVLADDIGGEVQTSLDAIMAGVDGQDFFPNYADDRLEAPLPPEVNLEWAAETQLWPVTWLKWAEENPDAAAKILADWPAIPTSDYHKWKARKEAMRTMEANGMQIPGESQSVWLKLPFDLQVYGTGWEWSNGVESYTWWWVTLRTDRFVGKAELWDGYTHASAVWTLPVWDNGAYIKGGVAHLKRNVTLWGETKWVKQTTLWWAVGMWDDVHNIEFGVIASDVARTTFPGYVVDPGDAITTYVEAILRYNPDMWQFDVALSAENTSLGDNDYGNARFTTTYYPTTNQGITFWVDTMEPSQDWNAQVWFNASFDSMRDLFSWEAKWSPYFEVGKWVWEHMDIRYTWRHGVAKDSLHLKDRFERWIQTVTITAQDLDPKSFVQEAEEPIEEVITPEVQDGPTTIGTPTLVSKTDTTVSVNPAGFTDVNGVKNVRVVAYSDAALTHEVSSSTSGSFSGLTGSTTYYFSMVGEAKNEVTGQFEEKKGEALTVTTDATNSAPTSTNETESTSFSNTASGDLADNVTDAETSDNLLTRTIVSWPAHGNVIFTSNTAYTYTATQPRYVWSDTFVVRYTDPGWLSTDITVTVNDIIN